MIQANLHKVQHHDQFFILLADPSLADTVLHGKFRGIDPLIKTEEGYQRLTQLDKTYGAEFRRVKDLISGGWYVKYTDPETVVFSLAEAS